MVRILARVRDGVAYGIARDRLVKADLPAGPVKEISDLLMPLNYALEVLKDDVSIAR